MACVYLIRFTRNAKRSTGTWYVPIPGIFHEEYKRVNGLPCITLQTKHAPWDKVLSRFSPKQLRGGIHNENGGFGNYHRDLFIVVWLGVCTLRLPDVERITLCLTFVYLRGGCCYYYCACHPTMCNTSFNVDHS